MDLEDLLREHRELLAEMEPEELAEFLLDRMQGSSVDGANSLWNFVNSMLQTYRDPALEVPITEAWWWLVREGLLVEKAQSQPGWFYISRRGRRIAQEKKFKDFRQANLLPKRFLHPVIAQKTWSAFVRGEYDTAVFQAFKQVEVAVLAAAQLPENLYGTDLMRKAFHPTSGPLTDQNAQPAEREGAANLFAGSIGSYKNPVSHRNVAVGAEEAAEMIILASHLLRIVDSRTPRREAEQAIVELP
jgi:uncharacterized protein (TIGR02391 family)